MADMSNEQGERLGREEAERLAGKAAVVIDPRLADVWQMIWGRSHGEGDIPLGTLAALLRLSYALGYSDALSEDQAGRLYEELGLRPAVNRSRSASRSRHGRAAPGSSGT